ncbi:MAG: hypothetical protein WCU80_09985 [Paludibacteraceae bacterium]|nr:hypothetical protein [Prevotellaceae bacterium]
MKKIISLAVIGSLSLGMMAQSYNKMRVLKNDGGEVFFDISEVKQVDFVEGQNNVTPFLAGTDETKDGPLKTTLDENVAGGANLLCYPSQLSDDPYKKHPVVIWGPGGGTAPGAYMGVINRMASQGFVVFATKESPGEGTEMMAAIDWLEQQNNNPNSKFYNKLLLERVGVFGHSMGGLSSEQALIKDKRVVTAVLNNSGAFNHAELTKTTKPAMIVYGEVGMEKPNAQGDYYNTGNKGPLCLVEMTGGKDTGEGGWGHGSGPWGGMAASVAWMRWHIGGESFRKKEFIEPNGKYVNGPIVGEQGYWKGEWKNWENWEDYEY